MQNIRTYDFNKTIRLKIAEQGGVISEISFVNSVVEKGTESQVLLNARHQLNEYFKGNLKKFDLPLNLTGTPFQIKVWKELAKIPFGKTSTYKNIANKINHPKAFRAIGGACNKNNFMIVIPCHRVLGNNGSLVGYAEGLPLKQTLLNLEKSATNKRSQ